ncbi:MAG: AsmA family protein, partial [Bacteroidales bacterium]|nr:AsmA family protein [Bacteroidales bacterium]
MKRFLKIFAKFTVGLVVIILAAMILIPVIFKSKIKEVVVSQANNMVNAHVEIGDYSLGFFKNFPNLAFSIKDVYVTGIDRFEGDTLAGLGSFSVVFNLASIFGDGGYEVKSIIIDKPVVNAQVLADGTANWDIMKPSEEEEAVEAAPEVESTEQGTMRLLLRKFLVSNATVNYVDAEMNMSAAVSDLNFRLSGDMTESETDLEIGMEIA